MNFHYYFLIKRRSDRKKKYHLPPQEPRYVLLKSTFMSVVGSSLSFLPSSRFSYDTICLGLDDPGVTAKLL